MERAELHAPGLWEGVVYAVSAACATSTQEAGTVRSDTPGVSATRFAHACLCANLHGDFTARMALLDQGVGLLNVLKRKHLRNIRLQFAGVDQMCHIGE